MSAPPDNNPQWLLLLGAILVNRELRDRATRVIADMDVPPEHREFWAAIKSGDGDSGRKAARKYFQLEPTDASCFDALLRTLQQAALASLCKSAADQINHLKGVGPDGMLNILDSLTTKIRAKQAALENTKPPASPT